MRTVDTSVEVLIQHGAEVNARNDWGQTPLLLAVDAEDVYLVKVLLERGAKVNVKDKNRITALGLARKMVQGEKLLPYIPSELVRILENHERQNNPARWLWRQMTCVLQSPLRYFVSTLG
jgi:ankyrin repeat protein